jgi:MinD superfamily P-loop ATPase
VERQLAQGVVAVDEDVERAELHLVIMLAAVASQSLTPSMPRMTASPSSTNRFCLTLRAASVIQG